MNTKLYVGNLSFDTTEARLGELFGQAGAIRSVTIPMDRATDRPRGFAFVEMETGADALNAIKMFDGREVDGRTIRVNEARPSRAAAAVASAAVSAGAVVAASAAVSAGAAVAASAAAAIDAVAAAVAAIAAIGGSNLNRAERSDSNNPQYPCGLFVFRRLDGRRRPAQTRTSSTPLPLPRLRE